MNAIFSAKRFFSLFSIMLFVASNLSIAQAQSLSGKKTGRESKTDSGFTLQTESAYMFDGSVTPVAGNIKCKDLSPLYEEFKIDPPKSGNYAFSNNNSVTANIYGGGSGLTYVDFHSSMPFVTVIVKGGNQGANVYSYNTPQTTGSGLTTPTMQDISHISFCYAPGMITTAALAQVSGRVVDENGRGISRSAVTIQNLSTEETRTVFTNPFGYYQFNNLPIGNIYAVTVSGKKVNRRAQVPSFLLNQDETNLNFTVSNQ